MRKVYFIMLLPFLLVISGCSKNEKDIILENLYSTSGTVDIIDSSGLVKVSGTSSSIKYTFDLTNNGNDITVISVTPVLSDKLTTKVLDKNVTININKNISKGESTKVAGEIVLDENKLMKEQIDSSEIKVKEFKVIKERNTRNGKKVQVEKTIPFSF